MKNSCPKCRRGPQIVCTYLGENKPNHHRWNHDRTNPACSLHEAFDAWDGRTPDEEYEERGQDKKGGPNE